MKFKKIAALALAGLMALSVVGCGTETTPAETTANSNETKGEDSKAEDTSDSTLTGKLVIWTLADDLAQFADKYMEDHEGVEIEVVNIAPADYPTKVTAALRGKSTIPDIIVGEPQMLPDFFEAGFFEDLSQEPYNAEQYADQIVDYIFEAGKDEDGIVRALSYQVTPGGIFYRRDIAQEVWGNEDPEFISEKFKDYETIVATAQELSDAGYRIFSDTGSLRWYAGGGEAWVVDGKINITDLRMEYFHTAVELYQDTLVAFAPEWSAAWYTSMATSIPVNAGWDALEDVDELNDTTEVFSYSLPSWGALVIRDNAEDNAGKFGVASGPSSYFGGGTFVGISSYSENKDLAWDFVKFTTLDEDTARWWTDVSKGDVVSMISVLEENKDTENATFGNQKTYAYFLEEAENIDYSIVTRYDTAIGDYFGSAIEAVQTGTMTEEDAMEDFYTNVLSIYPELER